MGCSKQFTLTSAATDQDYPFDAACYVSSVDKIFATMGPYVVKCNATTGAVEDIALVSSPAEGPCGICYHSIKDVVYVSVRDGKSGIYYTLTRPERDIFPVDPATMAVGAGLGVYGLIGDVGGDVSQGPMDLVYNGDNYIYFTWLAEHAAGGASLKRIDPDNIAGFAGYDLAGYTDDPNCWIQFGINPPNELYWVRASGHRVQFEDIGGVDSGSYNYTGVSATVLLTACEYCPADTYTYCVGGNGNMLRITSYTPDIGNVIDLTAVPGAVSPNPIHIRYNSVDGKLYLPSPGGGQVLIYDPIAATWDVRSGFNSPIDVVFTPTKAFAVQNSSVGLEEI